MSNICDQARNRQHTSLDIRNMETLLWDVIDRVMNAMIGARVKKYRSEKMACVNDDLLE